MNIIVNGTSREAPARVLTYEAVVALAGEKAELNPSVTFRSPRRGDGSRLEGILSAGQDVTIEEGMVFNAVRTGGA